MAEKPTTHALTPDMLLSGVDLPFQMQDDIQYDLEQVLSAQQANTPAAKYQQIAQAAGARQSAQPFATDNAQYSGDTDFSDYTRGFGKGTVDIASALAGVLEMTGVVDPGTLTEGMDAFSQKILQNMSPSARENLERRWTELGPEGVMRNPTAALGQLATVAPSVLASLLPAAGAAAWSARGAKTLQGADKLAKLAQAKNIGTAVGVGSEAAQIGGATYNDLRQRMDDMSHAELMEFSPQYRKKYKAWNDEASARRETLLDASRGPAAVNAMWGALVAAGPARFAAGRGAGTDRMGGTVRSRFAKGGAIEGLEETAQEVPGAYITDLAAQDIDSRVTPGEDMLEKAVASFALGAGVGGPTAALLGGGDQPTDGDVSPAVEAAVGAGLPPTEPESIEPTAFDPQPPAGEQPITPQSFEMPPIEPEPFQTRGQEPYQTGPADITLAEPVEDLLAQVWQVLDGDTNKQVAYLSPQDLDRAGEMPAERLDKLNKGIMQMVTEVQEQGLHPNLDIRETSDGGLMIALDGKLIDQYEQAGATDEARAALLGYTQPKSGLQNPDETVTVSKVNEDGTIAESHVVDKTPEAVAAAEEAYAADLQEGQRIEVEPTGLVLAERKMRVAAEISSTTEDNYGSPWTPNRARTSTGTAPAPEMGADFDPMLRDSAHTQTSGLATGTPAAPLKMATQDRTGPVEEKPLATEPQLELPVQQPQDPVQARRQRTDTVAGERAEGALARQIERIRAKQAESFTPVVEGEQMMLPLASDIDAESGPRSRKRAALADEAVVKKGQTKAEEAKTNRLFGRFERKFYDTISKPRNQWRMTQEQVREIKEWLRSQSELTKVEGITEQDVLHMVNQVLGGTNTDTQAVTEFLASERKTGKPKLRLKEKLDNTPVENIALQPPTKEEMQERARAEGQRTKLRNDIIQRSKERALKERQGPVRPHRGLQQLASLVNIKRAVRKFLVSGYGMTQAEADLYELSDKHFDFPLPMGKADPTETGRLSKFLKELRRLETALKSDDPELLLNLLNEKGLKAIAKTLVQVELKMPGGKAYAKVTRWRKNPAKENMPDLLRARLIKLFDRDVEGALALEEKEIAELQELVKTQYEEMPDIPTASPTVSKQVAIDIEGKIVEGETAYIEDTYNEPARTKSGKSGAASTKGKPEKTAEQKAIDAVVKDADTEQPAVGDGSAGSGDVAGSAGQLRKPESIIGPEVEAPAAIASSVFESKYGFLGPEQRVGVNRLLHRLKAKTSTTLLNDGTGVGKTAQTLAAAKEFSDQFEEKNGKKPKILIVVPNVGIGNNFVTDSLKFGLFSGKKGTSRAMGTLNDVDLVSYSTNGKRTLRNKKGEQYDLVIYDEAQKLSRPSSAPAKDAAAINATHTIYSTATAGDKEENLGLIAAMEGKTLLSFLQMFDPNISMTKAQGSNDEVVDVTSIGDKFKFYAGLAEHIQGLADKYAYFRRAIPRRASVEMRTEFTESTAKYKGSDGNYYTAAQLERGLVKFYQKLKADGKIGKYRYDLGSLWDSSTKISELLKVDETVKLAKEGYANEQQSILMFYYRQDDFVVPVGVDKNGNVITVTAESARKQVEDRLREDFGSEVVGIHGSQTSTQFFDEFQAGKRRIIVGTYESTGTGHNLDDSKGPPAWGRQLVMVSPSWSADQQDQAEGRVERAMTVTTPKVVMLALPDTQADLVKLERLQMKNVLRDVLSNKAIGDWYGMSQNLRVTEEDGLTKVRIYGLEPKSAPSKAIQKLLAKAGAKFEPVTQQWQLPTENYTKGVQEGIRKVLDIAGGRTGHATANEPEPEAVSTVETLTPEAKALVERVRAGEKAKATSKTRAKEKTAPAKPAKKKKAAPVIGEAPVKGVAAARKKRARLYAKQDALQEQLQDPDMPYEQRYKKEGQLDDISRELFALDAELNSVRTNSGLGPFSGAGRDNMVQRFARGIGFDTPTSMATLIRKLANSNENTPAQRVLLRKMAHHLANTPVTFVERLDSAGTYNTMEDAIRIAELNAETAVHEALHPVTIAALNNDPAVWDAVVAMMNQVRDLPMPDSFTEADRVAYVEAMNKPTEFVTYGLTNRKIHALIDSVTVDNRSGIRKLFDMVLQWLGIHSQRQRRTLSDDLYALTMDIMSTDRDTQQNETLRSMGASIATPIVEHINAATDQPDGTIMALIRKAGLPMTSLRQMETIYAEPLEKLKTLVGTNPVGDWADAMRAKGVTVKRYLTRGHKLHRDYMDAAKDPSQREALETVIGGSTLWEIWPNKDFNHPDNKHLQYKTVKKKGVKTDELLPAAQRQNNKDQYDNLRAVYEAMGKPQQEMYQRLADFYANERTSNFDLRISNILMGFEMTGARVIYNTPNGIETKIQGEQARLNVARGLRAAKPAYEVNNFEVHVKNEKTGEWESDVRVSELLKAAVQSDRANTIANGPYFPLKRFGEWVVTGYRNEKTYTTSLTTEELAELEAKYEGKPAKLKQAKQRELRKKLGQEKGVDDKLVKGWEADPVEYTDDGATQTVRERWVSMAETEKKALAEQERIVADGWLAQKTDGTPLNVTRKPSDIGGLRGSNAALITHMRSKLGLSKNEGHPLLAALEASIIDMMPDTAVHKELLKRKGILGFNPDAGRALASHIQSAAWYRGGLEHGKELSTAISGIKEAERMLRAETTTQYNQKESTKTQDVMKEIQRHIQLDANPDSLHWATRKVGELGFLGLLVSPAYMFINATQPGMIGLPWLSAYSDGTGIGASNALALGYKAVSGEVFGRLPAGFKGLAKWDVDQDLFDFLKVHDDGSVRISDELSERLRKLEAKGELSHAEETIQMLNTLSENDLLDFSLALDTSAAAEGKTQQNMWTRTMDVARLGPHLTEVLNRTVMATAGYQMARSQGMGHDEAVTLAGKAVAETQFDYTMLNKPRWMSERQYELAKPVFMFMQHPQHVYALFVQTAIFGSKAVREMVALRKAGQPIPAALKAEVKQHFTMVFGLMGTHLLMGGATAALFEPIKWALGMGLMLFEAITGEPPEDTEVYMERWMVDLFGAGALGNAAAKGLPTLIGLDISNNVSLSNMLLFNGNFTMDRAGMEKTMLSAMGPIPSVIGNAAQGYSDIKDGDVMGGMSKMMPRMFRDFTRAVGATQTGVRDTNGNELFAPKDISPLDLFYMSMGLKPRKVQQAQQEKARIDAKKNEYRTEVKRLRERLYRARNNPRATREVVADIENFNLTVPRGARVKTTLSPSRRNNERMLQELRAILNKKELWIAEEARIY